ncbi:hypothetical protein GCM10007977_013280 [Dactylosporangium sucinum]|uniref:Uncharacterized protein n=1 Tax=Dactylosporangium sucinum TaxID=1424081 RepID=A0A917T8C4_9ACTN|nr:hypothetical protein GCM10007977_013280 [Dactylosporangium sucinum]
MREGAGAHHAGHEGRHAAPGMGAGDELLDARDGFGEEGHGGRLLSDCFTRSNGQEAGWEVGRGNDSARGVIGVRQSVHRRDTIEAWMSG